MNSLLQTPVKKGSTLFIKSNSRVKCSNCSKCFSSTKKVLHSRYCRYNIRKCQKCKDLVPIEEVEEHLQDHEEVERERERALKALIELEEKEKKVEKLTPCQYCTLPLTKEELNEHEYMCGGKTEECNLCHKLVPRKFFDSHLDNECSGIERPYLSRSASSQKSSLSSSKRKVDYSEIRKKLLSIDKEMAKKSKKFGCTQTNKKTTTQKGIKEVSKNLMKYLNFAVNENKYLKRKTKR